ncbi:MAG: fumarylacetoacetate hydrolase family protein [Bacteroidota bacterium]
MKLIRHGLAGKEKPGIVLENGDRYDVSTFGEDFDGSFLGSNGINRLTGWLSKAGDLPKVSSEIRLGPPLKAPSKIVCIGLNYAKHAAESGMATPTEPVVFFKATSAIVGPNDDLVIPKGSKKTDWEVELGVIIGKKAQYVSAANAMDYVAGYVLHNDYSEREYQLEKGGQWVKGKSCDTFAPLGPYLVSADEIADPHNLELWLTVNGTRMQHSYTSDLIFNIPQLISYLSQYMSLLPGDMISTGTPSGVGLGQDPPRYLKPGDVVELGIEGLGNSRQVAKAYAS